MITGHYEYFGRTIGNAQFRVCPDVNGSPLKVSNREIVTGWTSTEPGFDWTVRLYKPGMYNVIVRGRRSRPGVGNRHSGTAGNRFSSRSVITSERTSSAMTVSWWTRVTPCWRT